MIATNLTERKCTGCQGEFALLLCRGRAISGLCVVPTISLELVDTMTLIPENDASGGSW